MNSLTKRILISALLTLPIILFTLPILSKGTANYRMMMHFDMDEFLLVEFMGKVCSRVFTPISGNIVYPQFFYNIAGILMLPINLIKGIDYQTIVIFLRRLNTIYALMTVVFLYYFSIKFFKSHLAAILAVLLFTTSPEYLWWLINSRPHTLEMLLILIVFYFCFKIQDDYQDRYFYLAVVFAGMAAATKYGGIFMIPIILLSYIISSKKSSQYLIDFQIKRKKIIVYICSLLLLASLTVPALSIFLYFKFHDKFSKFNINNFGEFIASKDFRLFTIIMIFVSFSSIIWLFINHFASKYVFNKVKSKTLDFLIILNNRLFILFCISLGIIAVFCILNPTFFIFPKETIKQVGLQIAFTTMGTGFNPEIQRPLFDFYVLKKWIKMFYDNRIFNVWFAIIIIFFLIREVAGFKKNILAQKQTTIKKCSIVLYGLSIFLFLWLFCSHEAHHYLLPIGMVLSILVSVSLVEFIKSIKSIHLRILASVIVGILLVLGFDLRSKRVILLSQIISQRTEKSDTGLQVGRWLENNYDSNTSIWKDSREFYIPQKFMYVYWMFWHEDITKHFAEINRLSPDILVITSELDIDLGNTSKVNQAIRNNVLNRYLLKKIFTYEGSLAIGSSEFGTYKAIFIYER